jgi:hypothetical protein
MFCYFHCENSTFVIFTENNILLFSLKITECGDIKFYSKDKVQYFTVENVINWYKVTVVERKIAEFIFSEVVNVVSNYFQVQTCKQDHG